MALTTWYGPGHFLESWLNVQCTHGGLSILIRRLKCPSEVNHSALIQGPMMIPSRDIWSPLIPVPSSYPRLYILPILEATSDVFWCLPPQLSNVTAHLPPSSAAHKCLQTESQGPWAQSPGYLTVFSFSPQSQISSACCTWNVLSYSYLLCFMIVFVNKSNPVSFILLWLKAGVPP